jgi:hypothetical protein
MTIENANMPAMPMFSSEAKPCQVRDPGTLSTTPASGLTKREQFCLHMGVPETGDEELNKIISKGNEQNAAMLVTQALISNFNGSIGPDSVGNINSINNVSLVVASNFFDKLKK